MKLIEFIKILKKRAFPLFRKQIKTTKIDGEKIKYVYIDKGTPYTIVFENGLGTGFSFWDRAFLELSKDYSVFAYNIPFKKDMKISKEKDWTDNSQEVTHRLKTLLDSCEVKAPYILVGHSLGGLYAQHFAKDYIDEVKAIVLVDATYPDEFADLDEMKMPPKMRKQMKILSINTTNMGQVLLSSPIIKEIPIMILSALLKKDIKENPQWKKMVAYMHKKQEEYLTLYPWAKQVWVESGHMIMYEKPEVVVDTVRKVIEDN